MKEKYIISRSTSLNVQFDSEEFWEEVKGISLTNYLWMNNNYKPKTVVKQCYNNDFLYVYFKVWEKEITATYLNYNDPVYKDSCVEFFINCFPELSNKYFNFEINAIGSIYAAYGSKRKRTVFSENDLKKIQISTSLNKPIIGMHENDYWEIFYKIPFTIFEQYTSKKINFEETEGNFYKCGDDSKYEHYGAWNKIISEKPNFHLPKQFGKLIFEK